MARRRGVVNAASDNNNGSDQAGASRDSPSGQDNPPTQEEVQLTKLVAERNKAVLEVSQLEGVALTAAQLKAKKLRVLQRDIAELAKTSADREKAELELSQLQGKALQAEELQAQKADEAEKRTLELQKLRLDAKNARWSAWFEWGKVIVPAGAIATSIYLSAVNISNQQERDQLANRNQQERDRSQRERERAVETSQQLVQFQNQMTATIEQSDRSKKPDIAKQRNAIAVVRSLGRLAVPSLLANLELEQEPQVWQALHVAVLELTETPELRVVIRDELLNSISSTAAAAFPDIPAIDRYTELWRAFLERHRKASGAFVKESAQLGIQLADSLKSRMEQKFAGNELLARVLKTVDRLRVTP